MSRWYRAYEGTVTDAKLAEAAMVADVSRAVSIAAWHCLLESAANINNCGSYETSSRRVAIILCEPPAAVEALFAAYAELGLIGDGVVLSWKKRQHESDNSAERTRKWREKKRQETAECDSGDDVVTSRDAPETETETDSSVSNETVVRKRDPDLTIDQLQEGWNLVAAPAGATSCRKIAGERRRRANGFIGRWSVEDITEAIHAVARSSFLTGKTNDGFRADVEFLFSDKHMNRLLEGFYR